MQLIVKRSVAGVFALIALGCAVSVYSEPEVSTSVVYEIKNSQSNAISMKQENISLDYAQAHAELMKKPDEAVISAF